MLLTIRITKERTKVVARRPSREFNKGPRLFIQLITNCLHRGVELAVARCAYPRDVRVVVELNLMVCERDECGRRRHMHNRCRLFNFPAVPELHIGIIVNVALFPYAYVIDSTQTF